MKIDNNVSTQSFKRIKLSYSDAKKVNTVMHNRKYIKKECDIKFLKEVLLDVYSPYIEKEAVLKAEKKYNINDILQDLYAALFEGFYTIKTDHHASVYLSNKISNVNPSKNTMDFQKKQIMNVSKEDITKLSVSHGSEQETVADKIIYLINSTPSLKSREKIFLEYYYIKGYIIDELAELFGITAKRVGQIIQHAKKKIVHNYKLDHDVRYRAEYLKKIKEQAKSAIVKPKNNTESVTNL